MALDVHTEAMGLLESTHPDIPELHHVCPQMDLWEKDEHPFDELQVSPFGPNVANLRQEGYERFISEIKDTARNRTVLEDYLRILAEKGYSGKLDFHHGMIEIWIRKLTAVQSALGTITGMLRQMRQKVI